MRRYFFCLLIFGLLLNTSVNAQQFFNKTPAAEHWVDSVFNSLTPDQKIAQLMIVRAHSNWNADQLKGVEDLIRKYDIGGLCFFQGGPVRQANLTNYYQSIAQTPLMICIDGEYGVGMRLDSVTAFPHQMMMGAVGDAQLIYKYGKIAAAQCKRLGIQVNYAPVVDVNNNPSNPVINDRSFGEDKYKVALYGTQFMKGLQDGGVVACAKHFPGHGDVATDSHYDLPIITKTKEQLDSLELYPFRTMIKEGVASMMVAHLYIPAIDTTKNQATSLSYNNVTGLLRNELGYKGLTFTDALDMQGVKKFFPNGEASAKSLMAGNDMLCLPDDIPAAIKKINEAIAAGKLLWTDIDSKVKKALLVKYNTGLNKIEPINTTNIVEDLNAGISEAKKQTADEAITVVRLNNKKLLPLKERMKIAFVGIGIDQMNTFAASVKEEYDAKVFLLSYKDSTSLPDLLKKLKKKYKAIIVGVHGYKRYPTNNYGLSKDAITLLQALQQKDNAIIFSFGNPYAIKNFCEAKNLVACYEDDKFTQLSAAELLQGKFAAKGKLPVTICDSIKFGNGITTNYYFPNAEPASVGFKEEKLLQIDAIANDAIAKNATPGCVVLVAKDGKIVYDKAFGFVDSEHKQLASTDLVYDLASVTKIAATTIAVMKLYEEGKLDLTKTIADYLPWVKGSDKANIIIKDLLLHEAGLVPLVSFYKEVIDSVGKPLQGFFVAQKDAEHLHGVAENMHLRNDYADTMKLRILQSKLTAYGKYVYSDNDFIFLEQIVESITQQDFATYMYEQFYKPLQMVTTHFNPREHYPLHNIAPTESDTYFRHQMLHGYVHDEGAAMFGGVAGHAGLFSNAYDLVQLFQMLLNGGEMNGKHYLQKETIEKFTAYNSETSRRGLGFDKPEKDNSTRKEPYPCKSASAETYGHTGFTGTAVWVDPKYNLVYIFLSNRVNPTREGNKLTQLSVRSNIQEAIYETLLKR